MFIKDIRDINEEAVKQTSKEVFLNMDKFFDDFYNKRDEIALLLITPKQAVAAHADRRINHGDLYSRMAHMMYESDDFDPIVQIKCASKTYYGKNDADVPNLMIPYISDFESINTDHCRIKGITAKEKFLLEKLQKVGTNNKLDFMGGFAEILDELKVLDDDQLNGYEEKIIGCPFKQARIKDEKEIDFSE